MIPHFVSTAVSCSVKPACQGHSPFVPQSRGYSGHTDPGYNLNAHTRARFARMTNKILGTSSLFRRQSLGKLSSDANNWLRLHRLSGAVHCHCFLVERLQLIDLGILFESFYHGRVGIFSHSL